MITRAMLGVFFAWLCWLALTSQWVTIAWSLAAQAFLLGASMLAQSMIQADDAKRAAARAARE